jgi:hypothetical protein
MVMAWWKAKRTRRSKATEQQDQHANKQKEAEKD